MTKVEPCFLVVTDPFPNFGGLYLRKADDGHFFWTSDRDRAEIFKSEATAQAIVAGRIEGGYVIQR